MKNGSHVRLCLQYSPETVHCSTKDVYTSEITFLALQPWIYRSSLVGLYGIALVLPNFMQDLIFFSLKA